VVSKYIPSKRTLLKNIKIVVRLTSILTRTVRIDLATGRTGERVRDEYRGGGPDISPGSAVSFILPPVQPYRLSSRIVGEIESREEASDNNLLDDGQ
jgi:hypothetical protein